jgi:CRISPR-associated protein Cas2
MFVAVSCDLASDDQRRTVYLMLEQYGFPGSMGRSTSATDLTETCWRRLKRDIDRVTDSYDSLRLYQYPDGGHPGHHLAEREEVAKATL